MPQKHSKNRGDNHHFTYSEVQEAGHGTQRVRFGADSQQPFGHCFLCIQPVRVPMASPSGHLYCKECIYEYLMAKTKELKRLRKRWEAQQEEFRARAEAAAAKGNQDRVDAFVAANNPHFGNSSTALMILPESSGSGGKLLAGPSSSSSTALVVAETKNVPGEKDSERKAAVDKLATKWDQSSIEAKREELKQSSFWLPYFQPEAGEEILPEPPKRPSSPISGKTLRLKELVPVNFTLDESKKGGPAGGKGRIICAVSQKEITSQPVVYLKKTGVCMLESVAKKMVYSDMLCPKTGERFKKKDVLKLKSGGTSFAASGSVEAKVYKPMMR